MFDYILINWISGLLVASTALATYLTHLVSVKSMSKRIRSASSSLYYPVILITISVSALYLYQVGKELKIDDVNRLIERGYITDDVALIMQEKIKLRLERREQTTIVSSLLVESPESISSVTYLKVKEAISQSKQAKSKEAMRSKDSESMKNAKLKVQELDSVLKEYLKRQKTD